MKFALVAAGLIAATSAQDLSTIPACAQSCLTNAIAQDGQCSASDLTCACGRIDQLTSLATSCVLSSCGQDVAINQVLPAITAVCDQASGSAASAGTTAPAVTGTGTASDPTGTGTASGSANPGSASPGSASPVPLISSSGASNITATETSGATPTGSGTLVPSALTTARANISSVTTSRLGNSTSSTNSTSSRTFTTAGAAHVGPVGGLAAILLGALAAL